LLRHQGGHNDGSAYAEGPRRSHAPSSEPSRGSRKGADRTPYLGTIAELPEPAAVADSDSDHAAALADAAAADQDRTATASFAALTDKELAERQKRVDSVSGIAAGAGKTKRGKDGSFESYQTYQDSDEML